MRKRPYRYIVSEGQSLEDVSITNYGDLEGVFLLLMDNPGLTLDSTLTAGQELRIVSTPISLYTAAYFEARGYRVNTGQSAIQDTGPTPPSNNDTFDYTIDFTLS